MKLWQLTGELTKDNGKWVILAQPKGIHRNLVTTLVPDDVFRAIAHRDNVVNVSIEEIPR